MEKEMLKQLSADYLAGLISDDELVDRVLMVFAGMKYDKAFATWFATCLTREAGSCIL